MRLALLLIALLAGNLFGQIDVSVVKYQQVTGLKNPVIIGSAILVESIDATIASKPIALIVAKPSGDRINRHTGLPSMPTTKAIAC